MNLIFIAIDVLTFKKLLFQVFFLSIKTIILNLNNNLFMLCLNEAQ